jgi:pyruvate/2-oxoglutarate dehydrogenase complex dihydrolipoamide acyltransferase (E2) component
MQVTLKMPKVGDAADKVLVLEIKAQRGDRVRAGDSLMLVETDKASVEVPSPIAGAVAEIEEVVTGSPTFTIET